MITVPSSRSTRAPLLVDLALQGGGSHGAFTWGVLDRLLEEPWLRIEGISGTSAGAMNAAVLVDGHAEGGADGARARLELFWKRVSDGARFSPFRRSPLDILLGRWTLDTSPLYLAFDLMARVFSPYDLNPRGVNPLTGILADCIDFKRVARAPIKLFVTGTNVRTGRGRVFRNAELTPDVLLASACLPTMFQAIEIDGEAYWDGGFAGNPTITPLIRECASSDTILIQVNPVSRQRYSGANPTTVRAGSVEVVLWAVVRQQRAIADEAVKRCLPDRKVEAVANCGDRFRRQSHRHRLNSSLGTGGARATDEGRPIRGCQSRHGACRPLTRFSVNRSVDRRRYS